MPTPKQQEFIDAWQEQNIPIELITYAYEKNIENIEKLSFPYINGVLTRWMEAGYRTREDVDKYDRPAREKPPLPKAAMHRHTCPSFAIRTNECFSRS